MLLKQKTCYLSLYQKKRKRISNNHSNINISIAQVKNNMNLVEVEASTETKLTREKIRACIILKNYTQRHAIKDKDLSEQKA